MNAWPLNRPSRGARREPRGADCGLNADREDLLGLAEAAGVGEMAEIGSGQDRDRRHLKTFAALRARRSPEEVCRLMRAACRAAVDGLILEGQKAH
ncbi:hypothetical protein [Bradyrhizobium canariense]|uniref:hypothetical protein n=1 Tax=Bradyrhizobium canariense TaxID=255045 RepID=UPI001B89FADD|nr:hypothetical protein [Bradyrhizobium canariense]MBR0949633.1 hypothetical protein [Bradyrhizobium canariense]